MSNDLSMAIDAREWRAVVGAAPRSREAAVPSEDAELIARCREGEENACRTLVRRYEKKAFWIAFEMVGDRDDALDIVQEAFVRVFRSIDRFDTRKNFYTWLYRIVTNLCIDSLRKTPKSRAVSLDGIVESVSRGDSPRDSLEKRELGHQIHRILSVLPPKYKAMIVLRDIEGHSCKDIAKIVGCSHANVRWRLHKARRMFQELWGRQIDRKGSKKR